MRISAIASASRNRRSLRPREVLAGGGGLVHRLPRADPEEDAAGIERPEGAEGLSDDRGVVAQGRGEHAGPEHGACRWPLPPRPARRAPRRSARRGGARAGSDRRWRSAPSRGAPPRPSARAARSGRTARPTPCSRSSRSRFGHLIPREAPGPGSRQPRRGRSVGGRGRRETDRVAGQLHRGPVLRGELRRSARGRGRSPSANAPAMSLTTPAGTRAAVSCSAQAPAGRAASRASSASRSASRLRTRSSFAEKRGSRASSGASSTSHRAENCRSVPTATTSSPSAARSSS